MDKKTAREQLLNLMRKSHAQYLQSELAESLTTLAICNELANKWFVGKASWVPNLVALITAQKDERDPDVKTVNQLFDLFKHSLVQVLEIRDKITCQKCGVKLSDDANWCNQCRAPLFT
ncbi:hypothetical protein CMO91_04115 [Candidatus Woesearchaeota archaeon]|nr:hypothetical protein [Candidatus Woesearchaeota archaeon]|tara:strand:+ start:52 stop:408 length:357 start_codon:yes stop_codon:yes gene_type:complete